jgi:Methylase involved in ubiquinone/menaquinone biosynthesis
MTTKPDSFSERYRNPEFVDFWRADRSLEAARSWWRHRLITVLPFEAEKAIRVLDLGAGTGALTLELFNRYPNATVTCSDYSEEMLKHAREQLAEFGAQVTYIQSDLRTDGWSQTLQGRFDAVICSFLTHTMLPKVEALYREVYGLVESGGCFVSCDFYSPPGPNFDGLYHRLTLREFQKRIKQQTGAVKSLEEIHETLRQRREKYRAFHGGGDEHKPAEQFTVYDHLAWLKIAGFDEVDCLVKYKNNAIIGGLHQ